MVSFQGVLTRMHLLSWSMLDLRLDQTEGCRWGLCLDLGNIMIVTRICYYPPPRSLRMQWQCCEGKFSSHTWTDKSHRHSRGRS